MSQSHEIMLQRVERLGKMSEEDRAAIRSLPIEEADVRADQDISRVNDRPSRSILIMSGLAATFKDTLEGKRQIHAFPPSGRHA